MKAAVYNRYGLPEVLEIKEVDRPVPRADQVLVRVRAAAVTSADIRMRKAEPFMVRFFAGLLKPRNNILGMDLAGEIEAVGSEVAFFRQGDLVFGTAGFGPGTYAEYVCLPEDGLLAPKPEGLSFEQAAAIFFGGHTALHFLQKGNIKPGQRVLVYGASGSVGTAAVQLAKHFEAVVTGVCSTANLELVRSLGADRVVDYTREDFSQGKETYDVIFDTVGKSPFSDSVKALSREGYYLRTVHMSPGPILRGLWVNLTTRKKVVGGVAQENMEGLLFLKELAERGRFRPVVDRVYPLEEIVEAHRYVETGHKKGNVVLWIGD